MKGAVVLRSERWSSMDDIKRSLSRDSAGPAVCYENGSSYIYDSEGHTLVMGTTGSGKSRRLIIPMVNSYLEYNESAVIVDPKGEVYRNTKEMIPPSYKVYLIDYRNIFSPLTDCFNPLYASYQLYKNGTEEDKYYAEQMVAELAHALYPNLSNKDPFWNDSARTLFIGVALSLFNYAKEEEVHLPSVHAFIAEGNQGGSRTTPPFINRFLRLCQNEQIAMNLESYVSTASETSRHCPWITFFKESVGDSRRFVSVCARRETLYPLFKPRLHEVRCNRFLPDANINPIILFFSPPA